MRQQVLAPHRKRAKGTPKISTIAIYASLFALIVAVVAVGYRAPQQASTGLANETTATTAQSQATSVDEVVATTIAAHLAESTNLSVAPNVAQLAVSTQLKSELPQANDTVITKPQILQPAAESRAIVTYVSKAGDTADSVAAQYGITKDTLKWANNLTAETIPAGKSLTILPVDGVQYTVKAGDTLQSIGEKYKVDQTRIVLYNDLDESGLTAGQKIILPGATLPNNERPGYVAPVVIAYAGYSSGFGGDTWRIRVGTPGYPGNTYAYGNCTRYAYDRRVELGRPVGAFWGNAVSWAASARAGGLVVNSTPVVGAIMQNGGYLGHVAIVEEILSNGDLKVSEMNASVAGGGYNIVNGRTVSASNVGQYLFIH